MVIIKYELTWEDSMNSSIAELKLAGNWILFFNAAGNAAAASPHTYWNVNDVLIIRMRGIRFG